MSSARTESTLALELLDVPVELACDVPELRERLRVCYGRSLRSRERRDGRAPLRGCLARGEGGHRVAVDGRPTRKVADPAEALRALNHELLHGLMLRAPELYYVHAAVVALEDRGIVLPGLSRAGKSTLALALVERGAGYLSDELLAFDPVRGEALSFPRAPKIRDECVAYFPGRREAFVGDGEGRFLPFAAFASEGFASEPVPERASPELVVLPRWSKDARGSELEPISRGQALLELAGSSLNFGTHRMRSLEHLGRLVAGVRAFRLRWSDPHDAARRVLEALG